MKVYTGTGDHGQTSLFSGERVSKSHARVEACGGVDELNSILGALVAAVPPSAPDLQNQVRQVQSELFHLGAWLATTSTAVERHRLKPLAEATTQLESAIDAVQTELDPLHAFILPGGHPAAAWSHVGRSVCRRVERRVVSLLRDASGDEADDTDLQQVLIYLNRLSDYLFVLARLLNKTTGVADSIWEGYSG